MHSKLLGEAIWMRADAVNLLISLSDWCGTRKRMNLTDILVNKPKKTTSIWTARPQLNCDALLSMIFNWWLNFIGNWKKEREKKRNITIFLFSIERHRSGKWVHSKRMKSEEKKVLIKSPESNFYEFVKAFEKFVLFLFIRFYRWRLRLTCMMWANTGLH